MNEKILNRYYLTQRPPSIGTHPRGAVNIVAFDDKQEVAEIGCSAWGYVEYKNPLKLKEIDDYELQPIFD